MARLVEDDLAVLGHARPHSLPEEDDVLLVEPVEAVLLEVRHRVGVVRHARHDVERDARAVAARERQHLARVEVEERLVGYRPDRVCALRPIEAEARSLSASHEQHAHAAGCKLALAGGHRLLEERALQHGHLRGRGDSLLGRSGLACARQHRAAPRHLAEVDGLDLLQQGLLLGLAKRFPESQKVLLTILPKDFHCLFVFHFVCL